MKNRLLVFVFLGLTFVLQAQVVKEKIPDGVVVLTFDDACASHYSYVAPLLKQLGFGATFFICEFPPNFADTTRYMNWRQIAELHRMGFEVANHTRSHPALQKLPKAETNEQLEYIDRKCDSMKIPRPVTFAYPGYGLSPEVLACLTERGIGFARAGGSRAYDPLTDSPLLVPSWSMTANNVEQVMEAFKQARQGRIVVLTIHGVPDAEHPWVNTPPEVFAECMHYLADNGYTVVSLRDLSRYITMEEARKIEPDYSKPLASK